MLVSSAHTSGITIVIPIAMMKINTNISVKFLPIPSSIAPSFKDDYYYTLFVIKNEIK